MENISNNIEELANLAVCLCYKNKKNKEFCWDVFGSGIVSNLISMKILTGNTNVNIPELNSLGEIEYLGENFTVLPYNLMSDAQNIDVDEESLLDFSIFDDIDLENLEVNNDSF